MDLYHSNKENYHQKLSAVHFNEEQQNPIHNFIQFHSNTEHYKTIRKCYYDVMPRMRLFKHRILITTQFHTPAYRMIHNIYFLSHTIQQKIFIDTLNSGEITHKVFKVAL